MHSDDVFNVVQHITEAKGNAKKLLLNESMKPYLVAAYDPFKQFYAKRKEDEAYGNRGDKLIDVDTWWLLDMLAARRLSGMEAQRIINEEIHFLTVDSARLFIRILNKDLRMGMAAKTINSVFPDLIPIHEIMLAKLYDRNRVEYPCWASIKEDGVRAVFKMGHFYSRRGHQFEGLEHLEKELADFSEPIDGELVVPGVSFQVSSGKIRSSNPTPDAEFRIFELPTMISSFATRVGMMEDLHNYGPHVKTITHLMMYSEEELGDFYSFCRKTGHEGAVVKSFDYRYANTRSWHWMKMKPKMKDLELKVVGVYEGEGKYKDMLGGVIVEYHGTKGVKQVRVGSGFTDEQREEFWSIQSYIKYRYIQAEAMEETDGGSLRHPVFKEVKD